MNQSKLLFLLLFFHSAGFSQVFIDSSTVSKAYKINPFTQVEVINKYGNIFIEKGSTDSVKFNIKIKISTNDSLNLENYIENIDFAFTESSEKIKAVTIFKPQRNSFLPSINDFQKLPVGENKMRVDYYISLPAYSKLCLNNKYGDIFIDESAADVDIVLSNGNLYCNTLKENLKLELQFGKGQLKNLNSADITLRYVDSISIEKSNSLTINTKSSKLYLNETERIKLQSKRDNIIIGTIDYFFADLFFTNITIIKPIKILKSESKHCSFTITEIGKELSDFSLTSNSDIIDITFRKYVNYGISVSETKSELVFSEKKFKLTQEVDSTKTDFSTYSGFVQRKCEKVLKFKLNDSKLKLK